MKQKINYDLTTIEQVVEKLKAGDIVALPTETVYGLAVDAENTEAITKLYNLKLRPAHKPFAVAIANAKEISNWVIDKNDDIDLLTQTFWPGPLTLVLPAASRVSKVITGGRTSVGLRCSSSPSLTKILDLLGNAVCLTSANISGNKEACSAQEIRENFKETIYLYQNDEEISGIPSTVMDLCKKPYHILRSGFLSKNEIESILGTVII